MTHTVELVRRFARHHIVHHWIMLVCFAGLVLTGFPQKYSEQAWAKGIILIFGGVGRTRFLHHLLGTVMALQLVWHVLEVVWHALVRRLPLTMVPDPDDVRHFWQQVMFNLGRAEGQPRMGRYTFAEKLEYLALVWGTALMVLTGVVLLYPTRWAAVAGEFVLASKAAHSGEALLAFLAILTWHAYFVHMRHSNKSIFNGMLDAETYAEEHALELERMWRDDAPKRARATAGRVAIFTLLAVIAVVGVAALWLWLRASAIPIITVDIGP